MVRMNLKSLLVPIIFLMVDGTEQFDPYKTLGVSRSASQAEIKEFYNHLIREWPEINQNPDAEEMFIKLVKSYEILANEEKRASYDRFSQQDTSRLDALAHDVDAFHDTLDESSSHKSCPAPSHGSDSKHKLHFQQYVREVKPDSFRRPYLILISSDYCPVCTRIQPVWRETVLELESLGIGFGVVNVGYERQLATHLGVNQTPSIVGVINGTVSVFQNDVEKRHLMQFVEDLLPQTLVEKVTDHNSVEFLESWHQLNKPRVVLFDQRSSVPLLYKLTAFAHKDYVRFGYVDKSLSDADNLLRRFNINTHAPTMLVFKEDTEKPAGILQVTVMKKKIVEEFIYNNRFLFAPHLISQKQFEELCPVRELHQSGTFCVLLFTEDEEESFTPGKGAFLSLASAYANERVQFAFASRGHNSRLCEVLPKSSSSQVVIVERLSDAGTILYKPVLGGWSGSQENREELVEQLNRLQEDPPVLELDTVLTPLDEEDISVWLFFIQTAIVTIAVKFLQEYCKRLSRMIKQGQECVQGGQAWSKRLLLDIGVCAALLLVVLLVVWLSMTSLIQRRECVVDEAEQLHVTPGPARADSTSDGATDPVPVE